MPRLEIRLSVAEAERLDQLRGGVPKGTWVKRRLGLSGKSFEFADGVVSVDEVVVMARAEDEARRVAREAKRKTERIAKARAVVEGDGPAPPKIAPRRWAQ